MVLIETLEGVGEDTSDLESLIDLNPFAIH